MAPRQACAKRGVLATTASPTYDLPPFRATGSPGSPPGPRSDCTGTRLPHQYEERGEVHAIASRTCRVGTTRRRAGAVAVGRRAGAAGAARRLGVSGIGA